MSSLHLLIVSGFVAAAAFFFAGYLLRPPRSDKDLKKKEIQLREALAAELMTARSQRTTAEQDLAEIKALGLAAEGARVRDEEKRIAAERERDSAGKEMERLRTEERTLVERLRAAEAQNRVAAERAEKASAQLAQAQAEREKQELVWREKLEELRAKVGAEMAAHQQVLDECRQIQAKEAAARRSLEELRSQTLQQSQATVQEQERLKKALQAAEQRSLAPLEQERERLEKALQAAEQREQRSLAPLEQERERLEKASQAAEQREQSSLAQLAEAEAAWQGKVAAAEMELRAQRDALQAERDRLSQQIAQSQTECLTLREQNASLSLAAHTAQDEMAKAQDEARAAVQALGAAEARLADQDRLAQENAELREEHAQAEREAKAQAGRGDEAKDAKVELAAAQAKLAELARLLEENQKLRDEVADLRMHQEASGELERLTAEHKRLRLDAELMARRLQELLQEQAELTSLRTQAADAVALVEEVAYLRRREQDLEAQIYASGFRVSREMPAIIDQPPAQTPISDMETNLHSLLGPSGPRTAVLADAQGFLIASAGQSVAQEGLAAFAAVAGDMAARARMLLPLAGVESVRVTDANSMVLTCHLFESEGQGLGLATLGAGEPTHESTAQAIVGLVANLSSGESDPET